MVQKTRDDEPPYSGPGSPKARPGDRSGDGETLTRAVTKALRERYERLQRRRGKASIEELRAIAARAAVHVKRPYLDHAELLYERARPSEVTVDASALAAKCRSTRG
jgi:hypothetical protein